MLFHVLFSSYFFTKQKSSVQYADFFPALACQFKLTFPSDFSLNFIGVLLDFIINVVDKIDEVPTTKIRIWIPILPKFSKSFWSLSISMRKCLFSAAAESCVFSFSKIFCANFFQVWFFASIIEYYGLRFKFVS